MENRASTRQAVGAAEAETRLRTPLDAYVARQSKSMQTFQRWMERLEVASFGIGVAVLIAAIVISINNVNKVPANAILAVWFIVPASFASPFMFLLGLHAVILRAFFPINLPGAGEFHTGRQAVWRGLMFMLGSLVVAAYWGMGAYAFINPDILNILIPSIVLPLVVPPVVAAFSGGLGRWLQRRSRKRDT